MEKIKEIAAAFLRLAASTNVREGYRKYVAPGFKHHNPYFAGDADSLMKAMEQNAQQFPKKMLEVLHIFQEGNLVAIHGKVTLKPGDRPIALAHIFRFEGPLIAELWDIAQPEPENSPNKFGMF